MKYKVIVVAHTECIVEASDKWDAEEKAERGEVITAEVVYQAAEDAEKYGRREE